MQVRIFDFSTLGYESKTIEENINSWLTANRSIKVIHVKMEILSGTGGESLFIFVFFEGPLGKGVFSEVAPELIDQEDQPSNKA